jgi:capsular polysaccharide transport system ATP-binding protein
MPVRTYSQGMKARLTFGLSMGIAFDTYLVDEVTATGDAAFAPKATRSSATGSRTPGADRQPQHG